MSTEEIRSYLNKMQQADKWDGSDMGLQLIKKVDQASLGAALDQAGSKFHSAIKQTYQKFIDRLDKNDEFDREDIRALNKLAKKLLAAKLTPQKFYKLWKIALNNEIADIEGEVVNPFTHFHYALDAWLDALEAYDDPEYDFINTLKDACRGIALQLQGDQVVAV